VPVLARTLETAGLATILVTPMPFWAEKIGTPRTLAVAFPFGHTLGMPDAVAVQMQVIEEALSVLETAVEPGTVVESTAVFPTSDKEARKLWHPPEPSPIVAVLGPQVRQMVREQRGSA
jgi:hypothetical protein